ncbi:MAG: type II toxin-antitoxin system prevent-host-death family antitoxin [Alphaproteobacteria bacterium]|nr:type II toxin-antitoxin system prevent-host-death family antitoxin [Alphaproteobacteria bacterium]
MPNYSVAQAKTHLSRLIDEAQAGEIVTITRHGKPVAVIGPARPVSVRVTADYLAEIKQRREARGSTGELAVDAVRAMRDERS